MRQDSSIMDDILKLGGSALSNLLGARHEVGAQVRGKMERVAQRLDLVSRSEFDTAFAMLSKARAMQENFAERLDAIESHLNISKIKPTTRIKAKKESVAKAVKAKKVAKVNLRSVKQGNQKQGRK